MLESSLHYQIWNDEYVRYHCEFSAHRYNYYYVSEYFDLLSSFVTRSLTFPLLHHRKSSHDLNYRKSNPALMILMTGLWYFLIYLEVQMKRVVDLVVNL